MKNRIIILACLLAIAAGCTILPERAQVALYQPVVHFDAPTSAVEPVVWRLALARTAASGQLNTPRILVRPAPDYIEVYPQAAWVESAATLLGNALFEALEADARITALHRASVGLERDFELLVELRAFELELADGPRARLRLRADLLRQPSGRAVAHRVFEISQPADGQEVAAAVAALGTCLQQLLPQVADWVVTQAQSDWQSEP